MALRAHPTPPGPVSAPTPCALLRGGCPWRADPRPELIRRDPAVRDCRYHVDSHALTGSGPRCVLDLAANGEMTLAEVALLLGVSRERVRQIERRALKALRRQGTALHDLLPGVDP